MQLLSQSCQLMLLLITGAIADAGKIDLVEHKQLGGGGGGHSYVPPRDIKQMVFSVN